MSIKINVWGILSMTAAMNVFFATKRAYNSKLPDFLTKKAHSFRFDFRAYTFHLIFSFLTEQDK